VGHENDGGRGKGRRKCRQGQELFLNLDPLRRD